MAVDFALFLSPEGIALAHRQPEGHWALIGETGLDVPDLGHRLTLLRETGEARGGLDFPTLLILPDDQILYAELAVTRGEGQDMKAAVGQALDGRTPYALGELAFDFRTRGTSRVQVAAVAQETLTEAMDFARAAGFNGAGFAATPPESKFAGVPVFEVASGIGDLALPGVGLAIGPDNWGLPTAQLPEETGQVFVTEATAPVQTAPEPAAPAEAFLEETDAQLVEDDETAEPDPLPDTGVSIAVTDEAEAETPDPSDALSETAVESDLTAGDGPGIEAAPGDEHFAEAAAQLDIDDLAEDEPVSEPPSAPETTQAPSDTPEPTPAWDAEPDAATAADAIADTPVAQAHPELALADIETVPASQEPPNDLPDPDMPEPDSADRWPEIDPPWPNASAADETHIDDLASRDLSAENGAEPAPQTEAEPPEPEPQFSASFAISAEDEVAATPEIAPAPLDAPEPAIESSHTGAASFAFRPEPEADAPTTPRFSTHRRLNAPPEAVARVIKKRRSRLGLIPTAEPARDNSAPPDPRPEPLPEPAPAPSAKGSKAKKKRVAKTPALFAGAGRAPEPATLPDPELDMPPPAPSDPKARSARAEATKDVPVGLPPGLAQRLRLRRAAVRAAENEGLSGGAQGASVPRPAGLPPAPKVAHRPAERDPEIAAARQQTAPIVGERIEIDDPVMTGGMLARRSDTIARPSLRTALVLTVVLVLLLALIAVWSALFLPDSRVARILGRVAPEVPVAEPAPETASAASTSAGGDAAPAPNDPLAEIAALTPGLSTPEVDPQSSAPLEAEPEDTAPSPPEPQVITPPPRVPPPSLEEAEAEYAEYSIWQLAPDPPAEPAREFLIPEVRDDIDLAEIERVSLGQEALAVFSPSPPVTPQGDRAPLPFGTAVTARGLVAPTPEGVLTPDGAFIVLGAPPFEAVQRPGADPDPDPEAQRPVALTAAGGLTDAILAAFPPTPRPNDFAEQIERRNFGGLTQEELGTRQPSERPASLQEIAALRDDDGAAGTISITSSPVPTARPDSIADAVAEALARGPAASASTASLTAPTVAPTPAPAAEPQVAPPAVEPDIPSNASVSRSATVENAINLREINLIGVRGSADNRTALVRLASGRFVTVAVGDRLDGGRVAAIGTDSLQYVRNGRNITLEAPSG
ncbi:MAG: hypothetical protein AAGA70_06015 [Pseudomonadota bacterium]